MKTTVQAKPSRLLLAALVASGALFAAAPAMASAAASTASTSTRPQEMQYGSIHYLTGGIGTGEAKAIKETMHKYALAVELAEKQKGATHEAFTAGAIVRISDHGGKEIFNARAEGPFMLVQLEPGKYSMTATLNDHALHTREFTIVKGKTTRETLVFPAAAD
jgi:hypothetical protein